MKLTATLLLCGLAAPAWACPPNYTAYPTGNISVSGNTILRDGVPWIAKGVSIQGAGGIAPPWESDTVSQNTYAQWRADPVGELNAIKAYAGLDVVRVLVSQPQADPQSSGYQPGYYQSKIAAVQLARAQGFTVILTVHISSNQDTAGLGMPQWPGPSTMRVWELIGPAFACDQGVILDVFNEPGALDPVLQGTLPFGWYHWQAYMQQAVDLIRSWGAINAIMADAMLNSGYVATATADGNGAGYQVGDLLTPVGGWYGQQALFRVSAATGGACTTVTIASSGVYNGRGNTPTGSVATTGGNGTGCTVTTTVNGSNLDASLAQVTTAGLNDPLRRIIYTLHPYLGGSNGNTSLWAAQWASVAAPIIITEWANASLGVCSTDVATYTTSFLNTVKASGLGMMVWTWDRVPQLLTALGAPWPLTSYLTPTYGCGAPPFSGGPGKTMQTYWQTGAVAIQ